MLVRADRRLAVTAIADARDAGCAPDDIRDALDEQMDGDERLRKARFEDELDDMGHTLSKAIDDQYCDAWQEAVEAEPWPALRSPGRESTSP